MSRPGRVLWDPGAQPERTYQAWTRTALSLAGCGLLLTRLTTAVGPVVLAVAGCVVLAALAVAAAARRRLRAGRFGAAPHAVAALAAGVVATAAAALVLLVVRG